jgi:hypothetical protein
MIRKHLYNFLIASTFCLLSVSVPANTGEAAQDRDQLQLIKKSSHGELRMDSGADWGRYSGIELQRATVSFRKHWARDQRNRSGNRPTEESMQRIKTSLSDLLDEVFKRELSVKDGFAMSNSGGTNVLRITPRIVNLDVVAPDRMRDHIGYSLADSKGSMTLELEISDSVNGSLLAHMTDNRSDPQRGYYEWTTTGTNLRAARFMFIRWAKKLRKLLVEAGAPVQD